MPELRWTLLIIGALFIVGLALWEFRRQRQAPHHSPGPGVQAGGEHVIPTLEPGAGDGDDGARGHREPIITFPELHPEPRNEPRLTARREPAHDPPVIEMDDVSFSRLHVEGETADHEWRPEDAIAIPVEDMDASVQFEPSSESDSSSEPGISGEEPPTLAPAPIGGDAGAADGEANESLAAAEPAVPVAEPSAGFATSSEAHESEQPAAPEPLPVGASAASGPIVDWPGEESRKVVALRLVSAPAARFPGRAVRQALAAEGFVLGRFDIFHKAGPDDRCVLSAANLTKPGTFTMNTMDAQRFGGISLFAVLPGPLPPQQTFDELLSTARNLNDRLQGALQDERGEPLTPMRSASIRQSLSDGSGSSDTGAVPQSGTRQ